MGHVAFRAVRGTRNRQPVQLSRASDPGRANSAPLSNVAFEISRYTASPMRPAPTHPHACHAAPRVLAVI